MKITTTLAGALVALVLFAAPVLGASYSWSGGSSGTWGKNDLNWGGVGAVTLWDAANGFTNKAAFGGIGTAANVTIADVGIYAGGTGIYAGTLNSFSSTYPVTFSGSGLLNVLFGNTAVSNKSVLTVKDSVRVFDPSPGGAAAWFRIRTGATLNLQDAAYLRGGGTGTSGGGERYLQTESGATLNMTGSSTILFQRVYFDAAATVNVQNVSALIGHLTDGSYGGDWRSQNGVVINQSGGTLGRFGWAQYGACTLNISGGLFLPYGTIANNVGNGGSPVFNLTGGETRWNNDNISCGSSASTFNLGAGSTMTMNRITPGSGTVTFNFDGGTLKALDNRGDFLPTGVVSIVKSGGVVILSGGKNITIASLLRHDSSGPAIDGGLAKNGVGMLTLTATNTYTGDTKILYGTLNISNAFLYDSAAVRITTNNGKLNLGFAGTDVVSRLYLNGVLQNGGIYDSNTLNCITGPGALQTTMGPESMPVVDITNYTGTVLFPASVTSIHIAGTNNDLTVGDIWWTNKLNGANGMVTPLGGGWEFTVGLGTGVNSIAVCGSNSVGVLADVDTINATVVYVTMTNSAAATIVWNGATARGWLYNSKADLPATVILYWGTNDGGTVKGDWQTETLIGANVPVGTVTNWLSDLSVASTYYYTFLVSNSLDEVWASNGSTVFKTLDQQPYVDVTSPEDGAVIDASVASYEISGTNNQFTVGDITWNNSMGGAGIVPAASTGWTFTVSLGTGDNVIVVSGINSSGDVKTDQTIVTPVYVEMTNRAATAVDWSKGTANGWLYNSMPSVPATVILYWGTNDGGTVKENWQTETLVGANVAAGEVAMVLSNLNVATTYYYTYLVTNGLRESWSANASETFTTLDWPACVDITNVSGTVTVDETVTSFELSGTNNEYTVGDITWSNSLGGADVVAVSGSGWSFSVLLAMGNNVITMTGTNTAGYGSTDTVTIRRTPRLMWQYKLEGNLNSSAEANTGTVVGSISYVAGPPQSLNSNQAAEFAFGSYATLGNKDFRSGSSGDFTIAFWFRVTGTTNFSSWANYNVVRDGGWSQPSAGNFYSEYKPESRIMIFGKGTWAPYYAIELDQWVHFAYVYTEAGSGSLKFYTNGVYVGATTMKLPNGGTTYTPLFGPNYAGGTAVPTWKMAMDDIRWYTVALTPIEVAALIAPDGPVPDPGDIEQFQVGRGAQYGQITLAWSNNPIMVSACTNRYYSVESADWFVLASGVTSPWTHVEATNFASVYYRIISGPYTSAFDVGKFDVDIAAGSISWLSFPFAPQESCNVLSEWFGKQLLARDYSSYAYPLLQVQNGIGGSVITRSYYIDTFGEAMTNWFPSDDPIVQNAGYVLFLAPDQPTVKLTSLGMVPTNDVTLEVPYQTIPWVGLSYPSSVDMRDSGIANLFNPPQQYSLFNYDFVDSQQTLGGAVWYAEYFIDDWGSGDTNFFIDVAGADRIDGGKGYLLFFSTTRTETGTWNYVKPY